MNHCGFDGISTLMLVADKGNPQCAKLLLESGANVNHADTDGHTALIKCWINMSQSFPLLNESVVKVLLCGGANVNMVDSGVPVINVGSETNGPMLLFAAGEMNILICEPIGKLDVTDGKTQKENPFFPPGWNNLNLKNQCRKFIRKHLLTLDRRINLFVRIPQLEMTNDRPGLPTALVSYLLYNQCLVVEHQQ